MRGRISVIALALVDALDDWLVEIVESTAWLILT